MILVIKDGPALAQRSPHTLRNSGDRRVIFAEGRPASVHRDLRRALGMGLAALQNVLLTDVGASCQQ
jgi:hypothetical protein